MQKTPTMDDVARAARCSRSAVSLALRSDPSIPESTRKRITAIAEKLGYRTHPLVSALMRMHRRNHPLGKGGIVIAYLSSHKSDDDWRKQAAFRGIYDGVLKGAEDLGFKITEFNLAASGMSPARMHAILSARNIRGIIVGPLPHGDTNMDFDFSSYAVVGLGISVHTPIIERVANDHMQSAALIVERCAALGYRRIGLALSRETSARLEHRWFAGYQLAVALHTPDTRIPTLMTEQTDGLIPALPAWIKKCKPDMVILDNPYPRFLRQIPREIGVASLSLGRPDDEVSGIFQNYELIGRCAVEHAASKLYTNSLGTLNEPHLHLVAGTWVRGMTAPGPAIRRPAA